MKLCGIFLDSQWC